ncbi:hypothetical protein HMPREF3218_0200398 [Prevotella bivia]|nr:hypothetical protein HMPREF3218_0200398 [Prevotella bivia]
MKNAVVNTNNVLFILFSFILVIVLGNIKPFLACKALACFYKSKRYN